MKGIKGKKVIVTGASSGIGQDIAIKLAEYGADVAINYYKDEEGAEDTEQSVESCHEKIKGHDVEGIVIQADVSKKEDVDRLFDTVLDEWGAFDILINNAGIQIEEDSHKMDVEDVKKVLDTNALGAFMCAQRAIQHFLDEDKDGVIVNVSSVHQLIPKPGFIGYSMSKGGMQNLTRTLALEYARQNIRINGIAPGATITPINSSWVDDPEKKKQVEEHIPMGRAGKSEEMAEITAFLCSDASAYVTGQTLFVDGGLTLYPDFRVNWSS